jgi:hypothetical protein
MATVIAEPLGHPEDQLVHADAFFRGFRGDPATQADIDDEAALKAYQSGVAAGKGVGPTEIRYW